MLLQPEDGYDMAQTDLLDVIGHEIYKDHCLKPSAFDLCRKRDVQSNPRSCIPTY